MKKFWKAISGVTLLEIMLVLAIAAIIIVMSIRYYQSATTSEQANTVMGQVQAITAAADSLAQGTGNYSAVTTTAVTGVVGTNGMTTPWNQTITINPSANSYQVSIPSAPAGVCAIVSARLSALSTTNISDSHISNVTQCNATGTTNLNYTYSYLPGSSG